jgi:hypothetical protein
MVRPLATKNVCGLKGGKIFFFFVPCFSLWFLQPFITRATPISYIDMDVHDKHAFKKDLCHGFCCSFQTLCVFLANQ